MQLAPYLMFDGQCQEAFRFYEKCFRGKMEFMTNGQSPMAKDVPPDQQDRVLHARLTFGENVLMASDAPPERYLKPQGFSVSLQLKDIKEGERIFQELAEDGSVLMPFQETFWAPRFGMVTDRFGIPWMINCEHPAHP
ncbi:MAG: VOC family protein [Acidobacteriales bacterium]|nr:VOC family protein [Terriglobales bacterium]